MIDKNDPRLTAYVMGELDASDSAAIASALEKSPELQTVVADIQRAASLTSDAFASQPQLLLTPEQKNELLAAASQAQAPSVKSLSVATRRSWLPIAIAASLLGLMVGGAFYFGSGYGNGSIAKSDFPASNGSDAPAVADESDAEIVASFAKENAPTDRTRSVPNDTVHAADKLQSPMAANQAFAGGMAMESLKQLDEAKDLVAGEHQNRLRFSQDNQAGTAKRARLQSPKAELAQEPILKPRQEMATTDKLASDVARTPHAGLKAKTLPNKMLSKSSSSGHPILNEAIEERELQLAQQTIDPLDSSLKGKTG